MIIQKNLLIRLLIATLIAYVAVISVPLAYVALHYAFFVLVGVTVTLVLLYMKQEDYRKQRGGNIQ